MPNRFILIRHGSTDWNIAKRYQGQTDIPLNNEGRKQAKELAKMLQKVPIDLIYTSDLSRAYETAEIIAEGRKIPIHRLKSFRETHVGHWEGLTVDEIHGNYPEDVERLKKDPIHGKRPGGESRGMMLERVNKAIHKTSYSKISFLSTSHHTGKRKSEPSINSLVKIELNSVFVQPGFDKKFGERIKTHLLHSLMPLSIDSRS